MTIIDIIKSEISSTKDRTNNLIKDLPNEDWMTSPSILNTNINWQIGHIFLANYLHGIASIHGVSEEISQRINIKDYIRFYGMNSNPSDHWEHKPSSNELLSLYNFTFDLIHQSLELLKDSELHDSTEIPNPSAKTKYQALMWLSKHQSWHNGQIAILRRIIESNK